MTTLTFDTHEFVKELKEAGFSEQQAEAITKLQKTVVNNAQDELATKRDLNDLEKDVHLKIEQSKNETIRWTIGIVVGVGVLQTSIITALVLKLIH